MDFGSGLNSFFTNMVNGFQAQHHQQFAGGGGAGQGMPLPERKIPPASKKAIQSIPMVTVTADDLLEETNKECAVCLVDQTIGSQACKLPCGHLYHKNCLTEWLKIHCTCPVCRYEIETDDVYYERERRKKMQARKPRYRIDELQAMKIGNLRELSRCLNVPIADLIDKKEIIDRLVSSGKIDVTEGVPQIELTKVEFMRKGVGELRQLLRSFNIPEEGAIEKADLRAKILQSGRVVVIESMRDNEEEGRVEENDRSAGASMGGGSSMDANPDTHTGIGGSNHSKQAQKTTQKPPQPSSYSSHSSSTHSASQFASTNTTCHQNKYHRHELLALSLSSLKELALCKRVDISKCLDRNDIIDAFAAKGHIAEIEMETGDRDADIADIDTDDNNMVVDEVTSTDQNVSAETPGNAPDLHNPLDSDSTSSYSSSSSFSSSSSSSSSSSASSAHTFTSNANEHGNDDTSYNTFHNHQHNPPSDSSYMESSQYSYTGPFGSASASNFSSGSGFGSSSASHSDSYSYSTTTNATGASAPFGSSTTTSTADFFFGGGSFIPNSSSSSTSSTTSSSSSSSSSFSSSSSSHVQPPAPAPSPDTVTIDYDVLNSMSIRELRSICDTVSVSYAGCLEKDDIINKLHESRKFCVINRGGST